MSYGKVCYAHIIKKIKNAAFMGLSYALLAPSIFLISTVSMTMGILSLDLGHIIIDGIKLNKQWRGIHMVWLSLIPPLITIVITFKTKKLIPALFVGVVVGAFINTRSLLRGITEIGSYIIDAVADKDSPFHTIAVGTILNSILQKVKGSKEKFAFVLSVTSL